MTGFSFSKDPIQLRLDENIILDKPLVIKHVPRGISIKNIQLHLKNESDQYYDIDNIFKIYFQLTEKNDN